MPFPFDHCIALPHSVIPSVSEAIQQRDLPRDGGALDCFGFASQ
ncbi:MULTISPECIES: hypothetical protein [Methylobacteriaceae]|nr:hypothetical protein [Methylobacterium sp. B4]